ncbi:MAG: CinA family nicotinamide mononucleotide deamidase-related protein [Saprospiraceae bacterium]|nr:CinA family nicotinamide mononucleotide deamidase-related protein [Saprospiraceae bacterium]MDW8483492.1 CinA family nicotinamide mononucleotide deamidase-related protein [Saprospiraceae bacterium]
MDVYLILIGDEILLGQVIDTNSAWIGQQLALHGYRITGKMAVADARADILSALETAAQRANIIITTGGLGPTKDDITRKTLAEYFGCGLMFHPETYDRIVDYYARVGRPLPDSARQQATIPERAVPLTNKVGNAPGMWFEREGKVFISLPGVPFEMQYLMTEEVLPRLRQHFPGRPLVHRTLRTAGEGETAIAKRIENFENALPPHIRLAYLPSLGQVRLRLSGQWPHEQVPPDAEARLQLEVEKWADELRGLLADIVYGKEEDTLEQVVGQLLQAQGLLLGTAESCTGGYIAHLITSVPGSSKYFAGSVVAYSNEIKTKLLGVRPETLAHFGAVSEQTVCEMVAGALDTLKVDVALSVSGIAGPSGGTPEKPVGTVWMAVGNRSRIIAQKHVFARDRVKNIQLAAIFGLNMVRKFLLNTL